MQDEKKELTAEQYRQLYLRAFARLEDITRMAEETMQELEELYLRMGDEQEP